MTEAVYPNLPRCQWCGDMLLSEMALKVHEPKCPDNPNREQSTVEDE